MEMRCDPHSAGYRLPSRGEDWGRHPADPVFGGADVVVCEEDDFSSRFCQTRVAGAGLAQLRLTHVSDLQVGQMARLSYLPRVIR